MRTNQPTVSLRGIYEDVARWWLRSRVLQGTLRVCAAWLLLSGIINLGYPVREPSLGDLQPAIDVTVLLAVFASVGPAGFRMPRLVLILLAALFSFVCLFRVGDGIALLMMHRNLNVFIDSQLAPDLVRLAKTTVPTTKLVGIVLGGGVLLALVGTASYYLLRTAARQLAERKRALCFAALVLAVALVGAVSGPRHGRPRAYRAFAASIVPRLASDFRNYWEARSFPEYAKRLLRARQASENPSGLLAELTGSNVLLIFVESYGESLLSMPQYQGRIQEAYAKWESSLHPAGFHFASSILNSPTVGGYSWLAHLTLATGIRVSDQTRYKKLYAMQPKTIVHYFVDAGYDTLIVQPATMRDPGPLIYPFTRHRYSWEFGYQGRNFSWAPMPDQFTLDFIHRNEIATSKRPLFVEYNLASGHMPWNDQAPIVDWDRISNGKLFRKMPGIRFNTDWSKLDNANEAYLTSMLYDLEVLRQYTEKFIRDDTLMIFLGDHQPVGDVTNNSSGRGVPIHVVSRNPRFVTKFVERGYARGMQPKANKPYKGMETFLEGFVQDFSR